MVISSLRTRMSEPKNVAEFVALAKARPHDITYGSAGFSTQTHLAAENFIAATKIDVIHIPYKGAAPAMIAVRTPSALIMLFASAVLIFLAIPTQLSAIATGFYWGAFATYFIFVFFLKTWVDRMFGYADDTPPSGR